MCGQSAQVAPHCGQFRLYSVNLSPLNESLAGIGPRIQAIASKDGPCVVETAQPWRLVPRFGVFEL
jgi:hypothetical protein